MSMGTSRARTKVSAPAGRTRTAVLIVPSVVGLHARPAALLVKTAQEYDSEIVMEHDGQIVNAKSIMGILTLGAGQGARITVTAEGHDADMAIRAIEYLFASSFFEENSTREKEFRTMERGTGGVGGECGGTEQAAAFPTVPPLNSGRRMETSG